MPIEVTNDSFDEVVLQRSYTLPVIVVFWVPMSRGFGADGRELEQVVDYAEGAVELVRAEESRNRDAVERYRVPGYPACLGFHNGEVISEFAAQLSHYQHICYLCETMTAIGEEVWYRRALKILSDYNPAGIPLVQILLDRGDGAEALEVLAKLQSTPETETLTDEARRMILPGSQSDAIEERLEALLPTVGQDTKAKAEFIELLSELDVGSPDRATHWRKQLSKRLF